MSNLNNQSCNYTTDVDDSNGEEECINKKKREDDEKENIIKILKQELAKERKYNFILGKVNKELRHKIVIVGGKLYGDIFKNIFTKVIRDRYIECNYSDDTTKFRNYKMAENSRGGTRYISNEEITNINIINNIIKNPIAKEKYIKQFDVAIDSIKSMKLISNRSMVKFTQMKSKRESSTEYFSLQEYKNIVKTQYEFILEFIGGKKSLIDKEIENIKSLSFSALDLIILNKPLFTLITDKDIENSINILGNSLVHVTCYKVFDFDEYFSYIQEFLELPLETELIIGRSLGNVYGFNNVVYLPIDNIDPTKYSHGGPEYNFYVLKNISEEIRYWEIDWRMENFIDKLYENLINFYTALFRKTYYNLYEHNIYKKENKLEQSTYLGIIFKNIAYVSSTLFDNMIKTFVKTTMRITPSTDDRFNLFSDNLSGPVVEPMSQSYGSQQGGYTSDYANTIKNLFDEISDSDLACLINLNV